MRKNKQTILLVSSFLLSLGINETIFAKTNLKNNYSDTSLIGKEKCDTKELKKESKTMLETVSTIKTERNNYQPYIQFGGTRFFHVSESNAATSADLFVPLWQSDLTDLVFTDLRINDRTGTPFEGNIHLGYRHLIPDREQIFGIYGAFDRKRTRFSNYFNQLTFGAEYWIKNWFIGGNFYQPIGKDTKQLGESLTGAAVDTDSLVWITKNLKNEKAMSGADAEVGYEFKKGLVGYVGGYYFGATKTATICGPRARLTYDWSLNNGRRILGIFDKVGLETGVQHDKPRGVTWYLSANVRIGWLFDKKSVLDGISRHMIDPVRRDIDVVSNDVSDQKKAAITDINGKQLKIKHVTDDNMLLEALNIADIDIVDVGYNVTGTLSEKLNTNANTNKIIVIDGQLDINNIEGHPYFTEGKAIDKPLPLTLHNGTITETAHSKLSTLGKVVSTTVVREPLFRSLFSHSKSNESKANDENKEKTEANNSDEKESEHEQHRSNEHDKEKPGDSNNSGKKESEHEQHQAKTNDATSTQPPINISSDSNTGGSKNSENKNADVSPRINIPSGSGGLLPTDDYEVPTEFYKYMSQLKTGSQEFNATVIQILNDGVRGEHFTPLAEYGYHNPAALHAVRVLIGHNHDLATLFNTKVCTYDRKVKDFDNLDND